MSTYRGIVTFSNGSMGGTHWTCFYIKVNKSIYFASFGDYPDKININTYQNQSFFISINFKNCRVDYVECLVCIFPI